MENRNMKTILLLFLAILLSGCIQTKEHLMINKDGSGEFSSDIMVPKATTNMVDKMFGGFMEGVQAMSNTPDKNVVSAPKESASEQMFANKNDIISKAKKADLNIEFIAFKKDITDEGLRVQYSIRFDDLNKLVSSGIIGTKFIIFKNPDGNMVCELKSDSSKAEESKGQLEQFKSKFKESEAGQSGMTDEEKAMMQGMMNALRNFKVEFIITMPNDITNTSGMFKKIDQKSASAEFSGDLFTSPEILEKLYGITQQDIFVICSSDGVTFDINAKPKEIEIPTEQARDAIRQSIKPKDNIAVDSTKIAKSRIYLKRGSVFEGFVVEETQDYVRIDVSGIIFKYPRSDIEKIE